METSILALALAAGAVAAFNPCGFAMLPAYLALVVGDERHGRFTRAGRAFAATGVMASGFLVVFAAAGLVLGSVLGAVVHHLPVVTVVVGVVLVGLGVAMLVGRTLTPGWRGPARGAPTARLGSMFGYGVAYALASLTCTIGPFLAATGVGVGTGSLLGTTGALLAFGTGMALVVGVLAAGAAMAGDALTRLSRRVLPHVHRISAVLMLLVGAYVVYYGVWEIRLAAGGDGADPIMDVALGVQSALVSAVGAITPGLLLAAGALPALGGVLSAVRRRRRAPSRADTTDRDTARS